MTVQHDLQKAIAAAKSQMGNYAMFAAATQDQAAKVMFDGMAQDMDRHIKVLESRMQYLNQNNQLNQQQQQQQQQQQAQVQQQLENPQ